MFVSTTDTLFLSNKEEKVRRTESTDKERNHLTDLDSCYLYQYIFSAITP